MNYMYWYLTVLQLHFVTGQLQAAEVDRNGYILYCPCMGRFGNQADHFLGALGFSKGLNRTLVLPPWVEYRYGEARSHQVPFDKYFSVEPLLQYHRVVTMEWFMKELADTVWPKDQRISFCYTSRAGVVPHNCNAKDGNPFGPFWDTFSIDFVKSEFYGPLNYDVHHADMGTKWNKEYPPDKWPVLAFTGAPGSFPVQLENRELHKYLKWNEDMVEKRQALIKELMPGGAYIGLHLRNGGDWVRACKHVADSPLLFAAPQCLGYRGEKGTLTANMCLPSKMDIIKQVKRTLKNVKGVRWLYVASDANHMVEELGEALRRAGVAAVRAPAPVSPHLDLAVLAHANYFIGNCVSSYSAFVKRERDARGLPSAFWAFPSAKKNKHEEL